MQDQKSNHTKGVLQIPFNYVAQEMEDGCWFLSIEILGQGVIARTYGKTKEECEANAQHIVKAVNMHVELIEENKELKRWKKEQIEIISPILNYMQDNSDKFNLKVGDSIFEKVLNLIKQSK